MTKTLSPRFPSQTGPFQSHKRGILKSDFQNRRPRRGALPDSRKAAVPEIGCPRRGALPYSRKVAVPEIGCPRRGALPYSRTTMRS